VNRGRVKTIEASDYGNSLKRKMEKGGLPYIGHVIKRKAKMNGGKGV
jgi:hypothetical protein